MSAKPDLKLVLNYAAVGFRPYREMGEFVNIGIVAVEAKSRYLCYRLLSPQRTKRISACFPELDLAVYREGLRRLENELSALAIETNSFSDDNRQPGQSHPAQGDLFIQEGDIDLFRRLTSSQASPFFYSVHGTRLARDAEVCLDDLYRRYVEHWNLAPVDYEEKKLVRRIRKLLRENRIERLYREAPWVGTEAYHVGIPLVFTPRGADLPAKAIKPLNLARSTPTRIYTHGDEWIAKVRRLQSLSCLPDSFLFVVKKPDDPEGRKAAEDICEGLVNSGAEVVEIEDEKAIIDFARIEEAADLKLKN